MLRLSSPNLEALDPEVATDSDGDSVVVWQSDNFETDNKILARTVSSTGGSET